MRLKKSCEGCRALHVSFNDAFNRQGCWLGYHYKIKTHKCKYTKMTLFKYAPLEICPKPRTWKKYDECDRKEWTKQRQEELEATQ